MINDGLIDPRQTTMGVANTTVSNINKSTDAGEEQEKSRSRSLTRGKPDVTFSVSESEHRSGLPRAEYENSKSNNLVC
jgi:hypothetical protein